MSNLNVFRLRWSKRELNKLDPDSTTGPDKLAGRILKNCSSTLALPVIILTRLIVRCGSWPEKWKKHWLHPLFKKGSVTDPSKYRGIHLTCILSKVVERILGYSLNKYFDASNAYGNNQWAFRPKRSHTDLVALLINSWLLALEDGHKVGIYLSDISGAFDRVFSPYLLRKLHRAGVNDSFLQLLADYLHNRKGVIIVNGVFSDEFVLDNMVYQGTVLGPILWNIFFSDIHEVAESTGCTENRFADDLSTYKCYPASTPNVDIISDLHRCRDVVHNWGVENRVSFDPAKEEFAVIHRTSGEGETFRLLGPWIDNKLIMNVAVDKIVSKCRQKLKSILRTARFYNIREMVLQFKTHVLPIAESCTSAIYHASDSILHPLDMCYEDFIYHLGLDASSAIRDHNLAPFKVRRDIAVLGLLHKCVLGLAHPALTVLLAKPEDHRSKHPTRFNTMLHNRQLKYALKPNHTD